MNTCISIFLILVMLICFPACNHNSIDYQFANVEGSETLEEEPSPVQTSPSSEATQASPELLSDDVVYLDDMSVDEISESIRGKAFQAGGWEVGAGLGEVIYFAPTGNAYYWIGDSADAQSRIIAEYGVWELDSGFMSLTTERIVERVGGHFAPVFGGVTSKYILEDYDTVLTGVSLESKMDFRLFQYTQNYLDAPTKEIGFRNRSTPYYHFSGLGGIERLRFTYEDLFLLLESYGGETQ